MFFVIAGLRNRSGKIDRNYSGQSPSQSLLRTYQSEVWQNDANNVRLCHKFFPMRSQITLKFQLILVIINLPSIRKLWREASKSFISLFHGVPSSTNRANSRNIRQTAIISENCKLYYRGFVSSFGSSGLPAFQLALARVVFPAAADLIITLAKKRLRKAVDVDYSCRSRNEKVSCLQMVFVARCFWALFV